MTIKEILTRKRDGEELSTDEIAFFIRGVVDGSIRDYQAAAWLMAVFLRGLSRRETRDLTYAVRDSGGKVDLSDLNSHPTLDKHSTGGVGDKTTLVVVPILAAAGIPLLKMSGRGLGHTGGTVDKLEAIPGVRTELSLSAAKAQVREIGAALIGQSADLAPADKILYSLRDVTATVESLPLIASSIMGKKLAAGAERILLDVKVGRGAFMKTREQAEELARLLIDLGNEAGALTSAVLSPMDEPLGRAVGNALEVREAVELMLRPGEAEPTFGEFCLEMAAHGLLATGKADGEPQAREQSRRLLDSGAAAAKFAQIIHAQGGPATCEAILSSLPHAPITHTVKSPSAGVLTAIDAEKIGQLAMTMGAGRQAKTDAIDPAVGIVFLRKVGATVNASEALATLHMRDADSARTAEYTSLLQGACRIDPNPEAQAERFWTVYLQ